MSSERFNVTKVLRAIGLMSGTSMDGVDAALIETDGENVTAFGPTAFVPFSNGFVESLRGLLGVEPENNDTYAQIVGELTALHADAVEKLLWDGEVSAENIDVIGFHGQTIYHAPDKGITIQIGDGQDLANRTGISVVADFRSADVAEGGQGAPLVPLFHDALCRDIEKPLAVLNIGGVANVTMLGVGSNSIPAFDTGPGNALIDDWILEKTGQPCDVNGEFALSGNVDEFALKQLMENEFFELEPPKSLDRNAFDRSPVDELSVEDGAATLTAFSAEAVSRSCDFVTEKPIRWLVCGGGRHNKAMMAALRDVLGVPVESVEVIGLQGDALEAQAFGFLAVRVLYGLPTSLPSTTGASRPVSGGKVFEPLI